MKQRIIDILKKNWLTELIIIVAIVFMIISSIRKHTITKLEADRSMWQTTAEIAQKQRDRLKVQFDSLVKANNNIQHQKDSIVIVKQENEKRLAQLIIINKKQIDSLINASVSNDSVYKHLQPIYPNYNNEPLSYPFAGSQIRQIYGVAIFYPRIQKEYSLQTTVLQNCNLINGLFKESAKNYIEQVKNLKQNIAACDTEITSKDQQIKASEKKANRKSFWNWTYKAAILAIGGIAIFK